MYGWIIILGISLCIKNLMWLSGSLLKLVMKVEMIVLVYIANDADGE